MKILNSNQSIRQQHPGRFRRPDDGRDPFAHVKDQKLANPKDVKETSIYINDVNVATLEKGLKSDFPKLFDFDSGVKYSAKQIKEVKKTEDHHQSYTQIGKTENLAKRDNLFDTWA